MVHEQKSRRDDWQSRFLPMRVPQSAQLYREAMTNLFYGWCRRAYLIVRADKIAAEEAAQ
jgi:hypothetical protein